MEKPRLYLISGFLGSGKTTLILRLLPALNPRGPVVVIENELGEIGIDGHILKDAAPRVVELTGGCVCCTLAGDIEEELLRVTSRYRPASIVLEPTGAARLSDVKRAFEGYELAPVVTCVDALNAARYLDHFGTFYQDQIMGADALYLTRAAGMDAAASAGLVERLRALNGGARIVRAPGEDETPPEELLSWLFSAGSAPEAHADEHEDEHEHEDTAGLDAASREVVGAVSPEAMQKAFARFENISGLYRVKGVLPCQDGWRLLQWTPGGGSVRPCAARACGALSAIGEKDAAKSAVSEEILGF